MDQGFESDDICTWNYEDCGFGFEAVSSDLGFPGLGQSQSPLIIADDQSLQKEQLVDGFDRFDEGCKRIKLMPQNQRQQIIVPFNLSSEESPLGLTLKKSPSLLELVEMKLSQGRFACTGTTPNTNPMTEKASNEDFAAQPAAEKLKASNFPATVLRIGSWERVSRYDGDLVAKCYYAKQKLVWEVLEHGLKSKIEFEWSDITALQATFRENQPGILEIELCHAPLFFRETNPQPRKHTLWHATTDFTGGQAPIHKRHFLQFPEGTLEKHYEKLLQCDIRLKFLSQKPFPSSGSPYFDLCNKQQDYSFEINDCKQELVPRFHHALTDTYLSQYQNFALTRAALDPRQRIPKFDSVGPVSRVEESNSPNSVFELPCSEETSTEVYEEQQKTILCSEKFDARNKDQIRGLDSTNVNLMMNSPNPIGNFLPQQTSYNFLYSEDRSEEFSLDKQVLDEIAEHLFRDSLISGASDEQNVIGTVNSMCCPIDGALQQPDSLNTGMKIEESDNKNCMNNSVVLTNYNQSDLCDGYLGRNPASLMPVQELDILAQIPRMASYPDLVLDQVNDFGEGDPNDLWNLWR